MKTKIITFLLLFTSALFIGCNNDDDASKTETNSIEGTWNLKNVSGGLLGVILDYSPGDVTWTFDESNGTLVVVNSFDVTAPDLQSTFSGLETGTYSFAIIPNGSSQYLSIDGNEGLLLTIAADTFTLGDGGIADGLTTVFEQ